LRPDRDVPDPDAGGALRNARLLALALAVLALLWAAVRAFAIRRRGFAPFTLAARKLRRHATSRDDPESVRSAYRVLHDAFNQVAGRAVFASQREMFLADHPHFAAEAGAVRAFFDRSEKAFFGAPAPESRPGAAGGEARGSEIRWLYRFARRLARLEQPGR
jgi:mxaA protein